MSLAFLPMILGAAPNAKPNAEPAAPAAPADGAPAEHHRGVEWRAAAAFFSLGSMTVVYPAGPGEPVELNRRSAEARARWLTAVHKNKVVVAADDQLTVEQKKGNLLILGWSNRLLATGGIARPFTHDKTGTAFLGIQEPDPRIDLLFFHRNPLHWENFVFFWSRIDPERDRFQVLPRVGSDWAMYHDYHPIRQGMFKPARVWPPSRDTLAEADHTAETFIRPGGTASLDSAHFHIVFDRKKFTDQDARTILQAREAAYAKAIAAIGAVPNATRIVLSVYDDDTGKQEATGVGEPAHEVAASGEIHFSRRMALTPSPREELHILAREAFGPCYLTAIYEGLALSYVNIWQGADMDTNAALLRSAGALPTVAQMLDEERFRAIPVEPGAIAAGVFMTWIRQAYGVAGLKKMYGLADGRPAALAAALGTTEAELGPSFTSWADARIAAHKNDIDFIAAEAEAQDKRVSSDWKGMVTALQKALKAKPGDPQTLFNLASAQMRAGDFSGAESALKTMLAGPLGPADSRFKIFGHYQLGRVYDLAHRRSEAMAEYDAVLALPDEHGAHALAKERKISPATPEQLE